MEFFEPERVCFVLFYSDLAGWFRARFLPAEPTLRADIVVFLDKDEIIARLTATTITIIVYQFANI